MNVYVFWSAYWLVVVLGGWNVFDIYKGCYVLPPEADADGVYGCYGTDGVKLDGAFGLYESG